MQDKHIGSSFDDFLQEEELMVEAEATALKRILAYQIRQEMELRNISKAALAGITD
jgi:antitoxin HicB